MPTTSAFLPLTCHLSPVLAGNAPASGIFATFFNLLDSIFWMLNSSSHVRPPCSDNRRQHHSTPSTRIKRPPPKKSKSRSFDNPKNYFYNRPEYSTICFHHSRLTAMTYSVIVALNDTRLCVPGNRTIVQ